MISKLKKFFSLFLSVPIVAFSASLSSCSLNSKVIFANYESYMAPTLMSKLTDEYPVRFDFYPSNENLITNFLNGTYTIGVPSTYAVIELIKKNSIEKLDWKKFHIQNNERTGEIENAEQALQLFSEPVQHLLQTTLEKDDPQSKVNLLEYGIPYFLQSTVFAYNDKQIEELSGSGDVTWEKILTTISSPKYRDRFGNGKLGIVHDERTIFSIVNMLNSDNKDVNPDPEICEKNNFSTAMKMYEEIFSKFSNILSKENFPSNPVTAFFNSDSSIILNKLSKKEFEGTILFNSDAIFAGFGGDFPIEDKLPIPGTNIHYIVPKKNNQLASPIALDMVVINKGNYDFLSESMKNDTYNIVRDTVLDGINDDNKPIYDADQSLIIEGENAPGPCVNFDYLNYVSPLKEIDDRVRDYFDDYVKEKYPFSDKPELEQQQQQNKILEEIMQAYEINPDVNGSYDYLNNLIEAPLTQKEKAIMIQSFLRFVENNF